MNVMYVPYYNKKERIVLEKALQLFNETEKWVDGNINSVFKKLCKLHYSSIALSQKLKRKRRITLDSDDILYPVRSVAKAKAIFKSIDKNGKIKIDKNTGTKYVLSLPKSCKLFK